MGIKRGMIPKPGGPDPIPLNKPDNGPGPCWDDRWPSWVGGPRNGRGGGVR